MAQRFTGGYYASALWTIPTPGWSGEYALRVASQHSMNPRAPRGFTLSQPCVASMWANAVRRLPGSPEHAAVVQAVIAAMLADRQEAVMQKLEKTANYGVDAA